MNFEIKELSLEDGKDIYEMLQKQPEDEKGFLNSAYGLSYDEYKTWLKKNKDMSMGIALKDWMVKQTIYWFYVDDKPVGFGKIRHSLTDGLREDGGNIGYCMIESERHKGYAKIFVKMLVGKMVEMGIKEILFTCDPDNEASIKAAKNCNAKVIKETNETTYLEIKTSEL